MNGQRRAFLALAGVVLLVAAAAAEQAKPAPPAPTAPAAERRGRGDHAAELVAPVRGQAELGYTKPVSKRDGKHHRHHDQGQEPGDRLDRRPEGRRVLVRQGGRPGHRRHRSATAKPLQPGEVIEVTLKTPRNPRMDRNQYKFEHANGAIKTTLLPKL